MGSFADTPACRAVGARFLGFGAILTWLATIALCTRSPARFARCMCSLAWLGRFVNMSLPEVAIQYISSGKRYTAGVASVIRAIGVVVCMSCQGRPSLVGLVTDVAFVHIAQDAQEGLRLCWH
jgi:hypothetical protein